MKNEKLLDVLGQVKEEFIEEAAPEKREAGDTMHAEACEDLQMAEPQNGKTEPRKKGAVRPWLVWTALAACAALVIGFGVPRLFVGEGKDRISSWPEKEDVGTTMNYEINNEINDEILSSEDTAKDAATSLPESEEWKTPDWGVVLTVKDVTPTGLTLICTREGGNATGEVDCGSDYFLRVKRGDAWEEVPVIIENAAWDGMAYWVEEGRDTVFEISWEWLYGKLPAGTYRLTKGFMDVREAGDYDTGKYWVEFVIE